MNTQKKMFFAIFNIIIILGFVTISHLSLSEKISLNHPSLRQEISQLPPHSPHQGKNKRRHMPSTPSHQSQDNSSQPFILFDSIEPPKKNFLL